MFPDMAVVIQQVVGELQGVKGDSLLHPLGPPARGVWVEVHPAWSRDVRAAGHQPGGAVEGVPNNAPPSQTETPCQKQHCPRDAMLTHPGSLPHRYLLSSTGMKSMSRTYSALGSIPEIPTWNVGNILLDTHTRTHTDTQTHTDTHKHKLLLRECLVIPEIKNFGLYM